MALSAFDSFCQAAEVGRFPQLIDRDDLWQVLVLITDGEDEGSKLSMKQAIEAAQKADAIIYGILYVDRMDTRSLCAEFLSGAFGPATADEDVDG